MPQARCPREQGVELKKILITYASAEGYSEKIATQIASDLLSSGLDITLADVRSFRHWELEDHEKVIVIASIHYGRHSRVIEAFVKEQGPWLSERPSAFLSVSLSAASDDAESRLDAQRMLDEFLAAHDWKPDLKLPVAGALRYSKIGFLKRMILRAKTRREGGPSDTSRDYEFTDWDELRRRLRAFLDGDPTDDRPRSADIRSGATEVHERSEER